MDIHKENIKCEKDGVIKYFSQHQLDITGQSPNGTYDGWIPQTKKPMGIPDPVQMPVAGAIATIVTAPVDLGIQVDPNAVPENPDANVAPIAPIEAPVEVDPTKVEKVEKPGKAK